MWARVVLIMALASCGGASYPEAEATRPVCVDAPRYADSVASEADAVYLRSWIERRGWRPDTGVQAKCAVYPPRRMLWMFACDDDRRVGSDIMCDENGVCEVSQWTADDYHMRCVQ